MSLATHAIQIRCVKGPAHMVHHTTFEVVDLREDDGRRQGQGQPSGTAAIDGAVGGGVEAALVLAQVDLREDPLPPTTVSDASCEGAMTVPDGVDS